jgi:predicted TIM-barrel fold metal-dependent hydrolase
MGTSRKEFLKMTGVAGLSAAGLGIVTVGCNQKSEIVNEMSEKDWHSDPEWQRIKYGDWGGPGVPSGPGPMDHVLLKNHAPRSSIVAQETFIETAKFPVIDVHIHNYAESSNEISAEEALANWVEDMDEVGVELSVVLTGEVGEDFDRVVDFYLTDYPDRFQLYCGILSDGIDQPDYPERAVSELERCYEMGARGLGEITDKGFGITRDPELAPDERLHPNDDRLVPLWSKAAELNMPVNLHIADHPSAWQAPDVFQERTPIYQQFNQHESDGLHYGDLLDLLPQTLQKNPDTTFIACHLANLGNDLGRLSDLLDQHSNLFVDISARDYEIGRTPRAAKEFFTAHKERVLFGTDMGMQKSMYQAWWRLLESADEHMPGRVWWRYYGTDLTDEVLEPLYRGNALRLMNWEPV